MTAAWIRFLPSDVRPTRRTSSSTRLADMHRGRYCNDLRYAHACLSPGGRSVPSATV